MNQGGKKHNYAQQRIYKLLLEHYSYVGKEHKVQVPNPKFTFDSSVRPAISYYVDVYAENPIQNDFCLYTSLGVEIDGKTGHKNTKMQHIKDGNREDSLLDELVPYTPTFLFWRFSPEDLVGRGYVHPKTKVRMKIKSNEEILRELGISI